MLFSPSSSVSLKEKTRLLKEHFLLSQMSTVDLSQLAAFSHLTSFKSGASIFRQGDTDTDLMIVVSGRIRLSATSSDGRELLVNVVENGHMFGEIAVIDGNPRSYDATAVENSEILLVRRGDLLPFLEKRPELCLTFLASLCERLRRSETRVQDSVFLGAGPRLARQLLNFAKLNGRPDGASIIIEFISQTDFANALGVSRETINRQLCKWRGEKIISFERRSYKILNLEVLKQIADAER